MCSDSDSDSNSDSDRNRTRGTEWTHGAQWKYLRLDMYAQHCGGAGEQYFDNEYYLAHALAMLPWR
jgi:hypothetical protein